MIRILDYLTSSERTKNEVEAFKDKAIKQKLETKDQIHHQNNVVKEVVKQLNNA